MSTGTRFGAAVAVEEAEKVRDLFADCIVQGCVAGSLRRGKTEVGDVEHVIIPRLDAGGLFGSEPVNLLLERLDELVRTGRLCKAVKSDGKTRWGARYRAVTLPGGPTGGRLHHELWMGDDANWGSLLCIRTGPQEFSTLVVTKLREKGLCNDHGYVRHLVRVPTPAGGFIEEPGSVIVAAPTEEEYLRLAGIKYAEPHQREALATAVWKARRA